MPLRLPDWVAARRQLLPKVEHLEPATTALLVIDLQRCFVDAGYPVTVPNAAGIIPRVNRLAAALRGRGGQIVWLRHTVSERKPFATPAWYEQPDSGYVRLTREHLTDGARGWTIACFSPPTPPRRSRMRSTMPHSSISD